MRRSRRSRRWGSACSSASASPRSPADAVTGIVAGVGAGGIVALRADQPHSVEGACARGAGRLVVRVRPRSASMPDAIVCCSLQSSRSPPSVSPITSPSGGGSGRQRPRSSDDRRGSARFDDDAREYVITRPDTPLPWINYLGQRASTSRSISNTGGGYSFYRDARLRRLTRYRYNNVPRRHRRPFPLPARRRDRRVLVAVVAAGPSRSRATIAAAMASVTPSSSRGEHGIETESLVPRASRRGPRDVAGADHERSRRPPRASRCSAPSSSACGTRGTTRPTSSATCRPARCEVPDGVIFHTTEYRERREPLRLLRLLRGARRLRHAARRLPRARTAGGTTRRRWRRGSRRNSIAHGWAPIGSHHVRARARPGRDPRGRLRARLRGEPAGREVRPARIGRR